MGRIPISVSGKLAHSIRGTERLKSNEFLAIESRLATLDPYRECNDLLNLITRRSKANNNTVYFYTEYEDVLRIGNEIENIYDDMTHSVLEKAGVLLNENGKVIDHSTIDDLTNNIAPSYWAYSAILNDPDGLCMEEKEIWEYANQYNADKAREYQIHGSHWFEADITNVCYICVDDVLVHRNNRIKLVHKNGKWVARTETDNWIFHSVGYVEYDNKIYIMEASSQDKIYAMILAFLLENDLQDKYLIIFTDGEEALKEKAEELFRQWPHKLYLDYYHLKENLEERFSRIFRPGKIIDDTVEVEYFKNGKVKKSSIQWITRSQYHLRAVISMLWAGNVSGAIKYLNDMKGTDNIKAGGNEEIDKAIKYLNDKKDRIPCYALRKHLNLRNTSNSVEIANNILVARRQKKKGTSWSDDGSFAVSGISVVFANQDAEEFFNHRIISFKLRRRSMDISSRHTGLEWIVDSDVDYYIRHEIQELEVAS